MDADLAIDTSSLTKVFRTRWARREVKAVNGISLQVRRGATYGFLGPNGAGKTTFVKMLLSAVHPSSGSARIFGKSAENRRRAGRSAICLRIIVSRRTSREPVCSIFMRRCRA